MSQRAAARRGEPTPRRVELLTPEQTTLFFELASVGSRMMAVLIDLLIILGSLIALALLVLMSGFGSIGFALFMLGWFLVRNFYFTFLEFRWRGRTVGKRVMRLRVIARDGGPLTPGMIFARNLAREVELFLPIQLMIAGRSILGVDSALVNTAAALWVITSLILPAVHKQRARLGDLVAGTLVVVAPQSRLRADLAARESPAGGAPSAGELTFTREQLGVYGILELQTLEEVLRMPRSERRSEIVEAISQRVMRKIDWPEESRDVDPGAFLQAFYAAQRHRLEKELLFGRRKETKRD